MVDRFRSMFFSESLLFIVLGLLKDAELSEWEILNLLYLRHESNPSAKEFQKLLDTLQGRLREPCPRGPDAETAFEQDGRQAV
jgi:hypothetical protein